jgi:heavy metal translocating P-type ATPase
MSDICCNHSHEKDTKPSPKGIKSNWVTIPISGMHCPACALNIEKSLLCVNGVMDANVNFIDEKVAVRYDPYRTDIERIKKAITRPGYVVSETPWEKTRAYWAERIFFVQMAVCAALVIAANLIDLFNPPTGHSHLIWELSLSELTLSNILSLGVIVIGGYTIFKGAIQALSVKDLNVFSLVSIASIAAVVVGAYKEAAMVILIMLIGETLERFALRQSRKAVTKLLNLAPVSALVKRDGTEMEIPSESVKVDDIAIIKPGARIPVDGIVVKGNATINESTLTGESLPVDKKEGDVVYSGTINEGNAFEMKATKTGDDTKFALIKRLILEAESQKAPIQRVVDRYARYFVPLILAISSIVFILTSNVYMAITLLIVACPCALVLATPTAVVTGLANASRKGILIKGGQYLEALGSLDALLIDKTGTLTTGKLSVTDIVPVDNNTESNVLLLAGLAERRSEHPIARAVLNKAAELKLTIPEPDACEIFKGSGIKATCKDKSIMVGNSRLITEEKINITPAVNEIISRLESQGKTTLLVVSNSNIVGIVGVTDTVKPHAIEAIQKIKHSGIKKIAIITGDNNQVASAIAQQVGLEEFYSGMLPEDKVNKLRELKAQGFKVGMVGDGVNDAPALAASDVGMAMGAFGSDVAIEAADVSLMSDDLGKIPQAIALSRRVLGVIRQNLIFSVLYNIAMMVAVTQFVHHQDNMIWGAVAHQFSSLLVIANSLRLLR